LAARYVCTESLRSQFFHDEQSLSPQSYQPMVIDMSFQTDISDMCHKPFPGARQGPDDTLLTVILGMWKQSRRTETPVSPGLQTLDDAQLLCTIKYRLLMSGEVLTSDQSIDLVFWRWTFGSGRQY